MLGLLKKLFGTKNKTSTLTKEPEENIPSYWIADPLQSRIIASVVRMEVINVDVEFKKFNIEIFGNPRKPNTLKAKVIIDANSVDSGNITRDEHIKSPDFLDTKKYPYITFETVEVVPASMTELLIKGFLEIKGQKHIVFAKGKITKLIEYDGVWDVFRSHIEITAQVNRKQFGAIWPQEKNLASEEAEEFLSETVNVKIYLNITERKILEKYKNAKLI